MNMKKTFLYMIAAALTAVSCNEIRIEEPVKYGTLSISLAGEPSVDVVTKTDGALSSEQAAGYNIAVYNNAVCTGSPVFGPKTYSSLGSEPIVLAEGYYYVWAESCSSSDAERDNEGNGCVRLEGKSETAVQVKAGLAADASVTCYVANAKISVTFDDSVAGHFVDGTLKVKLSRENPFRESSASYDKGAPNKGNEDFWFNSGSVVKYEISGTSVLTQETVKKSGTIQGTGENNALASKDYIIINVKASTTSGVLKLESMFEGTNIGQSNVDAPFNPYN